MHKKKDAARSLHGLARGLHFSLSLSLALASSRSSSFVLLFLLLLLLFRTLDLLVLDAGQNILDESRQLVFYFFLKTLSAP
jgi:hypothetical protein